MELHNLAAVEPGSNRSEYEFLLLPEVPEEAILMEFKSIRDLCIITDRKIIAINVQGLTGRKKEILVLPFSKMTAFAVESSGTLDTDAELVLWSSGIGKTELEFLRGTTDVRNIARLLAQHIR